MDLLRDADPNPTVVLLLDDASEEKAEALRCVYSEGTSWTHERGIITGRPYESLHPGESLQDLCAAFEQATYEVRFGHFVGGIASPCRRSFYG